MDAELPLILRLAEEADEKYLVEWLSQPGALSWFPLADRREIEDAARIWMSYRKHGATLVALWNSVPCGVATLYLQPYKKLAHQCLFAIIVDEPHRGKGIGETLIRALESLGKDKFGLELLHLEVYEGNPAIRLYERLGFSFYGLHRNFVKENGGYRNKIMMQKSLKG